MPGETIEIGGGGGRGGEGVGEWFNWWFVSTIDSFEGESGGSDMQIDACWTDNLSSCSDFCSQDWIIVRLILFIDWEFWECEYC